MNESLHRLDADACRGDGICVEICPEKVLEVLDGKAATVRERADKCILCGQCVAVCPNEALGLTKLPNEGFQKLAAHPVDHAAFLEFLRHRRSVRAFKDAPVERPLIEKILEAAATAPMGMPPHSTRVLILDRREELDFLLGQLVKDYAAFAKGFSNPLYRLMVRLSAGAANFRLLRDFVLEVARNANEAYHRDGTDRYMYGAPVLMLFHGSRGAVSFEENAHLVCDHAMLAALSLGLGSTIIGMIPPVVDRSKILRERYGITEDNKVITSLIIGYPKYKYRQGIHRELAGVRYP
jgi:nitroreductase/NAD-dependent dihydropyrimidine dehydrogenase PreA subunit